MKDVIDHLMEFDDGSEEIEHGLGSWVSSFFSKEEDPTEDLLEFIETADKRSRDAIINALRILIGRWSSKSGSLSLAKIALEGAQGFITIALASHSGSGAAKNVGLAIEKVKSLKSIAIMGATIGAVLTLPSLGTGLFGIASGAANMAKATATGAKVLSTLQTIYNLLSVLSNITSNALRAAKLQEASELLKSIDKDLVESLENSSGELETPIMLDELMDEAEQEELKLPTAVTALIASAKGLMAAFGKPRVVFVPGTMGSKLGLNSGRTLWGPPTVRAKELVAEGDGIFNPGNVRPTGFVDLPPSYPAIQYILPLISDYLAFPYDWRLSNTVNAQKLKQAILRKWPDAQTKKVTLISHSMGGLVARAFVESSTIQGYRLIDKFISGGTPHLGAPQAYTYLAGIENVVYDFMIPVEDQTLMMNANTSIIQAIPYYDFVKNAGKIESRKSTYSQLNTKYFNTSDPKFPNTKLKQTLKNHKLTIPKVLDKFRGDLKNSVTSLDAWLKRVGVKYHLIGSTGLLTVSSWDRASGKVIKNNKGDGTVPLFSALMQTYNSRNPTQIIRKTFNDSKHGNLFMNHHVLKYLLKTLFPALPISAELEYAGDYEQEYYETEPYY